MSESDDGVPPLDVRPFGGITEIGGSDLALRYDHERGVVCWSPDVPREYAAQVVRAAAQVAQRRALHLTALADALDGRRSLWPLSPRALHERAPLTPTEAAGMMHEQVHTDAPGRPARIRRVR